MDRRLTAAVTLAIGITLSVFLTMTLHATSTYAGVQAAVYYVDQNHPSASDSNPGSEALPWRTIQKAANTLNPGDIVYVKAGIYDERVMIKRDGTPAEKITFQALPRR